MGSFQGAIETVPHRLQGGALASPFDSFFNTSGVVAVQSVEAWTKSRGFFVQALIVGKGWKVW